MKFEVFNRSGKSALVFCEVCHSINNIESNVDILDKSLRFSYSACIEKADSKWLQSAEIIGSEFAILCDTLLHTRMFSHLLIQRPPFFRSESLETWPPKKFLMFH